MKILIRNSIIMILLLTMHSAIADDNVKIIMVTSEGSIEIELYADKAPGTVGNFLRYIDGGIFDGGSFYRVVTNENDHGEPKIEVIQGGMNRNGKAFPPIDHETTMDTGILHTDGVISMARGDVGTANSEFFICIGDQPGLDFGQNRNTDGLGFAAFGKVTSGMDVVRAIEQLPANADSKSPYTKGQMLDSPVAIISISRK